MTVRLISITPDAEKTLIYCARVSSPNQDNPEFAGLIRYLIQHKHWSPFEMAHAVVEVETSRMISQQILRHRSFCFQEHSLRYAEAVTNVPCEARRQDTKNRQNSIDDLPPETRAWWRTVQKDSWNRAVAVYDEALEMGIAKEVARAILPLNTATRLYISGNLRSFIHYFDVRCGNDTQKEHREIALQMRKVLAEHLPTVAEALEWI